MKLPHADRAIVPERKITLYLLNPAHPAGGSKARFFHRFGYMTIQWQVLAEDLMRHARANEVVAMEPGRYGTRYVVDGFLTAPDGTCLKIRAAWFIDLGTDQPRFVTAHPLPKS